VLFNGIKRPLHEAVPDIFYYDYMTDLEIAVWNYHAKKLMKDNDNG